MKPLSIIRHQFTVVVEKNCTFFIALVLEFVLDDVMMFEMGLKGGNIKSLSTIHYQLSIDHSGRKKLHFFT